eukprot:7736440-Prorocentrum_lima.AAC.1
MGRIYYYYLGVMYGGEEVRDDVVCCLCNMFCECHVKLGACGGLKKRGEGRRPKVLVPTKVEV